VYSPLKPRRLPLNQAASINAATITAGIPTNSATNPTISSRDHLPPAIVSQPLQRMYKVLYSCQSDITRKMAFLCGTAILQGIIITANSMSIRRDALSSHWYLTSTTNLERSVEVAAPPPGGGLCTAPWSPMQCSSLTCGRALLA
jgi:hypothetical protein